MTGQLRIEGHTDSSGSTETNRALRAVRADWLRDRLRDAGVTGQMLQESRMDDQAGKAGSDFRGATVRMTLQAADT
jgi:hypothetical protein